MDNLSEYNEPQIEKCATLLKKFDAVSVREDTAVNLCKEHFGVDAVQMLDPTLLLTKDDYIGLFSNDTAVSSKGKMLVYILDNSERKDSICDSLASEINLIPFWLDSPDQDHKKLPVEYRTKMPVEQWLRSFYDADFVLTDSFHGCVFSIIFHKPFVVIGNCERGLTRIESLLNLLDLNDRMVLLEDDLTSKKYKLQNNIDFTAVDSKLQACCESALNFLKYSIGK